MAPSRPCSVGSSRERTPRRMACTVRARSAASCSASRSTTMQRSFGCAGPPSSARRWLPSTPLPSSNASMRCHVVVKAGANLASAAASSCLGSMAANPSLPSAPLGAAAPAREALPKMTSSSSSRYSRGTAAALAGCRRRHVVAAACMNDCCRASVLAHGAKRMYSLSGCQRRAGQVSLPTSSVHRPLCTVLPSSVAATDSCRLCMTGKARRETGSTRTRVDMGMFSTLRFHVASNVATSHGSVSSRTRCHPRCVGCCSSTCTVRCCRALGAAAPRRDANQNRRPYPAPA